MIAYVDGGSRGNRGPAGIGVVIEHPTGRRVEISQCIGIRDNNYAEYAALLVALEYAAAYASPRLQVYSDSEVVVRQISESYTCRSTVLRDIYKACKDLIDNFQGFEPGKRSTAPPAKGSRSVTTPPRVASWMVR